MTVATTPVNEAFAAFWPFRIGRIVVNLRVEVHRPTGFGIGPSGMAS